MKKNRIPKTKAELVAHMKQEEKINKMVMLTKLMWPLIESQEKIYDSQTTFNAIAGYIELGMKLKEDELTVGSLGIDLKDEKDSPIKQAMLGILGLVEHESARDVMTLARKIADMMGQYGANEFLKGPMSTLKVTDLVK